ncbi:peptide chain release factor N(5)-glutamine methyltransferase [Erysipelotrichaceae bacterium OttesenSCG-928-M19]|nr:peptide chain release factor N(5)-glutamine methyltransferase [Erysipelotrichaceae bacterium OttesenSCG-928-M19]
MSIRELLKETVALLYDNNREEKAAYDLLQDTMQLESYQIYSMLDEEIEAELINEYRMKVSRYLDGEPLQYILGYEMFLGRNFSVDKRVLIPRYETEELVENILYHIDDYFSEYQEIKVADIGCGSGAISISLDLEEPKTKVIGCDISKVALEVAKKNNDLLNAKVKFMQGDLLQPLISANIKLDILVSNPPYIPNEENIALSVKDYEPNIALFGGHKGIDFYIEIFKDAKKILNERALLAFEIGHQQKADLLNAATTFFEDAKMEVLKDINGKDRMLFIYLNI